MAEALLGIIIDKALAKSVSLITEEISLAWGFKGDLFAFSKSMDMVRTFLIDAERRQVSEESVKLWLKRLGHVADKADDVFDELNYEILRRKVEIQDQMKRKVCFFFSVSNPVAFRFKMAHKIKEINTYLEEIKKEAIDFNLHRTIVDGAPPQVTIGLETHSFKGDSVLFGRENDASKIVEMLISSNNQEILSVIPIVGMGGLGKTAFAKLIYNDEQIERHFNVQIWMCIR